jgi:hypothetical protein
MSYFNHAFNKVFVGTTAYVNNGTTLTQNLALGEFGFMNPNPGNALNPNVVVDLGAQACPLVLVSGALYASDKIGPFHGGYQETNKSKTINPKYVSAWYVVEPCVAQPMTISVGLTPFTDGEGTVGCDKQFLCGNNYYLRVDLKGAPELRFLTRNSYYTAMAYTGCCPVGAVDPIPVDPTTVYIQWAKALMTSPLMAPFISITIYDTAGNPVVDVDSAPTGAYNKTTYDAAVKAGTLAWDLYESPAGPFTTSTAGMYIQGAYVDTQFGDCTFYPNDALQAFLEPVKIYASEVDYNGDPCAFTGLCVANTCAPRQSQGYGETVLRELILSEGYNQSPFYTGRDLRIREITQGNQLATTVIDRASQYYRYYIQHSVPRFNNPSGTFDNDQYLLEIITLDRIQLFEDDMVAWLTAANSACVLNATGDGPVVYSCAEDCTEVIPQPLRENPGALTPRAQP